MLKSILKDYGFSDIESSLYLTCLEYGSLPVASLARLVDAKRMTTQSALYRMIEKGFVSSFKKGRSTYYAAVSPVILKNKLEAKLQRIRGALPDFFSLAQKFDNTPKIQFFEGIEGLKCLYGDLLTSKTDICSYLCTDFVGEELLEYLYTVFLPQRVENKIFAKVLVGHGYKDKQYADSDFEFFKESRQISDKTFQMSCGIDLYDEKIAIMMYHEDELCGLLIHSKKLYDSLLSIFYVFWIQAGQAYNASE